MLIIKTLDNNQNQSILKIDLLDKSLVCSNPENTKLDKSTSFLNSGIIGANQILENQNLTEVKITIIKMLIDYMKIKYYNGIIMDYVPNSLIKKYDKYILNTQNDNQFPLLDNNIDKVYYDIADRLCYINQFNNIVNNINYLIKNNNDIDNNIINELKFIINIVNMLHNKSRFHMSDYNLLNKKSLELYGIIFDKKKDKFNQLFNEIKKCEASMHDIITFDNTPYKALINDNKEIIDKSIESHMYYLNNPNNKMFNKQDKVIYNIKKWERLVLKDMKYTIAQLLLSYVFGDTEVCYFTNCINFCNGYNIWAGGLINRDNISSIYDEINHIFKRAQELLLKALSNVPFKNSVDVSKVLEYINTKVLEKYSKFIYEYNKDAKYFIKRSNNFFGMLGNLADLHRNYYIPNANNKFEDFKNILNVYKKINDIDSSI